MSNVCRISEIGKRESRRRTLLCCSTCCLLSMLIFFILLTEFFGKRSISLEMNSNETTSFSLNKYHSSLIQCGRSVVQNKQVYQQLTNSIEENLFFEKNLLIGLELILKECYRARQFSIIEQTQPTILTKLISSLRKEFLYVITFFIKDK